MSCSIRAFLVRIQSLEPRLWLPVLTVNKYRTACNSPYLHNTLSNVELSIEINKRHRALLGNPLANLREALESHTCILGLMLVPEGFVV